VTHSRRHDVCQMNLDHNSKGLIEERTVLVTEKKLIFK